MAKKNLAEAVAASQDTIGAAERQLRSTMDQIKRTQIQWGAQNNILAELFIDAFVGSENDSYARHIANSDARNRIYSSRHYEERLKILEQEISKKNQLQLLTKGKDDPHSLLQSLSRIGNYEPESQILTLDFNDDQVYAETVKTLFDAAVQYSKLDAVERINSAKDKHEKKVQKLLTHSQQLEVPLDAEAEKAQKDFKRTLSALLGANTPAQGGGRGGR